ncbi:MAG: hypothetical protein IRZ08_11820 [Frankia sp.]|nr:hypothetical protein [Frankia sp.]
MDDTAVDAGAPGPEPTPKPRSGDAPCIEPDLGPQPGRLAELPPSLAEVIRVRGEDGSEAHELVLSPGATAAAVTSAMVLMPPAAELVGHHGDVDLALVFREPDSPPAGHPAAAPGEPARPGQFTAPPGGAG